MTFEYVGICFAVQSLLFDEKATICHVDLFLGCFRQRRAAITAGQFQHLGSGRQGCLMHC